MRRFLFVLSPVALCLAGGSAWAGEAAGGVVEMSTWELVRQGGWLMFPIGLCSLIGLAYAAERFINLRQEKIMPGGLARDLKARLKKRDIEGAVELCRNDGSPFGSIMLAGLKELPADRERVEKTMEDAGAGEVVRLRQNIRPLKVVSEISPLLGLLGTIQGMMGAFQKISGVGIGGKTELFAGDIFKALTTTVAGLTVAIPALFLYYYFVGRINKITLATDRGLEELLMELRKNGTLDAGEGPKTEESEPVKKRA